MELDALHAILGDIHALGGSLVAISPQMPDINLKLVQEKGYGFDILFDAKNEYTDKLNLRFVLPPQLQKIYGGGGIDLPKFSGDDSWSLPMPARFVVDQGGVVRYSEVNPDYTMRPEPEDTLAAMKTL